jgi:hypothetical protein
MTIFASSTGGKTWSRRYRVDLESRPAAYSDLVDLGSGRVGVLYETGVVKWKERIAFRRVSVSQILSPTAVAARLRVSAPSKAAPGRAVRVEASTKVAGIASPPGRVTVSWSGRAHGSVAVTYTYSNRGRRHLTLPRLPRGRYTLTTTYTGNERIASSQVRRHLSVS